MERTQHRVAPVETDKDQDQDQDLQIAAPEAREGKSDTQIHEAKPPRELTMRQTIYATMEDPSHSFLAKSITIFMMTVILFSTACFILESEVCNARRCADADSGMLPFYPSADFFYISEWICVVIFTLDYVIRFSTAPRPVSFFFGFMNLIDLAAFLPFWIIGAASNPAFPAPSLDASSAVGGIGFVRAIRLIRVFRIFRVGKYSLGIKLFGGAIKHSAQSMGILFLVLTVSMIIFSSILWLIERPDSSLVTEELMSATGRGDMQTICFGTIPSSFWWALTTMTTVGYGDCYPITLPGKMISVVAMISGIVVLALPITVLGNNYLKMVEMYEEDMVELSRADASGDGEIDELELREFVLALKKEGRLRKDVDTRVSFLMAQYDHDKKGFLNIPEFTELQHVICVKKQIDMPTEIAALNLKFSSLEGDMVDINKKIDLILAHIDRQQASIKS